ncbi:hypothetical protein ACFL6U_29965, partial [Planctomycetota bacterium]
MQTGGFSLTADFDPGTGTFNLISNGGYDVFLSKLDNNGDFLWARSFGGSNVDHGYNVDKGDHIALDQSGNIYTIGHFSGTADFDPGPEAFNLVGHGYADIFVSKLDSSGSFVWASGFGSTGWDSGWANTLDQHNRVYITGSYGGTIDFDPGPGTFNLTPVIDDGFSNMFVCKYNQPQVFTLTDAELDNVISVSKIVIGDTTTGNISITGPIDPANVTKLELISGATIGDSNTIGTDITVVELILDGEIAPGQSPGVLTVDGNVTLKNNSTFEVEIGGATPGDTDSNHDQLDVTGAVNIGNNVTLDPTPWDGYVPVAGDEYTIIENDEGDAIVGTFKDLPEGATISNFLGSGLEAIITYQGGDGNDAVLTTQVPATTTVSLVGGSMLIEDTDGGDTADALTLLTDETDLIIREANPDNKIRVIGFNLTDVSGDGTTEVRIKLSAFTGGIFVNTYGNNDSLTIDCSLGEFSKAITYDGGTQATATGDSLALAGDCETTAFSFWDASSGSILMSHNALITYYGLEPITSTVTAAHVMLDYGTTGETIEVTDAGGGQTTVTSTAGETTTFNNPTGTLTINAGGGDDTIDVTSLLASYPADVTINGQAGSDTVNFDGTVSLDVGKDLAVTADTINVNSDVSTSGAGTVSLTADKNIAITPGSSITTVDGNITMSANTAGAVTGNFAGIVVDDAWVNGTAVPNPFIFMVLCFS